MNKNIKQRLIQIFSTLPLQSLLLFAAAGTLACSWAGIFLATGAAILMIDFFLLPREYAEFQQELISLSG